MSGASGLADHIIYWPMDYRLCETYDDYREQLNKRETAQNPEAVMARIVGTSGRDVLRGTSHRDVIIGKGGNDKIIGRGGNDKLKGGKGNDKIKGKSGNDKLIGGKGNDKLIGGNGNDKLNGGAGNDKLDAGKGDDKLDAGAGNDKLDGGPGDDILMGGDGNDLINGGLDRDTLLGGSGGDVFQFNFGDGKWIGSTMVPAPGGGFDDVILDWVNGQDLFDVPGFLPGIDFTFTAGDVSDPLAGSGVGVIFMDNPVTTFGAFLVKNTLAPLINDSDFI